MNSVIILVAAGIASMFVGVFKLKRLGLPVVILSCIAALLVLFLNYNGDYTTLLNNMLQFDAYSFSFSVIMILITMGVLFISKYYYRENVEHLSDIYALFIFSLIGGILVVSFQSLVMLFLGIEILSIPLYILAASNRKNLFSNEAGLKYFLMGSFASCFLLLGITLIYGISGSFNLNIIGEYVIAHSDNLPVLFVIGCVLIIGAILFKISAVPFHFWAPDVYQGSPTVITAFMATVVKTAAFGALIRFIGLAILSETEIWQMLISIVAALTLIVGNITALYQTNLKRLLAYSGVANAGYVLIAVAGMESGTADYILYYLASYSIASILAFTIYSIVKDATGIDTIDGLKGLFAKNKLLAFTLAIAMLSLAGIPPLAGFFGKYVVFVIALHANMIWLVVIGVLTSLTGIFYYLKVMANAFQTSGDVPAIALPLSYKLLLIAGIALLLALGVMPDLFTYLRSTCFC